MTDAGNDQAPAKVTGKGPAKPKGGRPARSGAQAARERAHIEARRATVEFMHLNGATIRQIAEQVEVDVHTVHDDLSAIRERRRNEHAAVDLTAHRDLELDRLEQQRKQLAPLAAKGVLGAHRELLGIAKRKAQLLGLDAPQQVALSGEVRARIATHLDRQELAALLLDDVGLD